MTYCLPFKPGDSVIEFGGGDNAIFPVNVDMRPGPKVSLVADLNQPLPIESERYDGAFSMFLLEHLSWRRVKSFIAEIHRILKPGGVAVLVTANLLEQARKLVETPEWNDDLICIVFGDQNYEGGDWIFNAHHCGFSPKYAARLFAEAGFHQVSIYQHPNCATDMIIEARKSGATITYDRHMLD